MATTRSASIRRDLRLRLQRPDAADRAGAVGQHLGAAARSSTNSSEPIRARRTICCSNSLTSAAPTANSNYHALQTKLDKRFSNGLQFNANYTWSKAMNYANDEAFANYPRLSYGPRRYQSHERLRDERRVCVAVRTRPPVCLACQPFG